jgi:hypothetical protein
MEFKQTFYPFRQSFQTYLNFEKVQREIKPVHPLHNKSLNAQNIKPNKFNSLSTHPMSEFIPPFNNPSKGIPHMDYLPLEYPPYYAPFETGSKTFTHRQFYTKSN